LHWWEYINALWDNPNKGCCVEKEDALSRNSHIDENVVRCKQQTSVHNGKKCELESQENKVIPLPEHTK
jgi:hypothetical protein